MPADHEIKSQKSGFIVIEPWGEQLVDLLPTRAAAQHDIDRCKCEDAMFEMDKELVDAAIEAHMRKVGLERKAAQYWICSAVGA